MSRKPYIVCSNPKCSFSRVDDYAINGCPLCGSTVVDKCPHCESLIWDKGAKFCGKCVKPLYPLQEEASE